MSKKASTRQTTGMLALILFMGFLAGCVTTSSLWEQALSSDTIEAYEQFLAKQPNSEYAEEAKQRLDTLYLERDWAAARQADDIEAYQDFLNARGDSQYAPEAKQRLETLCAERDAAMLQAAAAGDTATVERMLNNGAHIDTKDKYGDTALHLALKNRQTQMAEFLVERGANVNEKGALDDTPLHVSMYKGEMEMAELLRRKGADDTLLNRYGLNPAEMQGLPEVERKITDTALLLNTSGNWTDPARARALYNALKARADKFLINSLVLQIIRADSNRLQVLILGIKLGIPESEEKLVSILMVYGDKSMAEDYLNSGSTILDAGARRWAGERGYSIMTGPGSHRATWGSF